MSNQLRKLIAVFPNKPVPVAQRSWFVNREVEQANLQNIAENDRGNIYGITSQRGGGKTSLINLLDNKQFNKIILNITERKTREFIYCDLIYGLCVYLKNIPEFKKYHRELEEIEQFISTQLSDITQMQIGAKAIITAGYNKGATREERFNIYTLKKKLSRVLEILAKSKNRRVLFIDEIDKESREDVLILLDTLKHVIWESEITVFFTLPETIYEEFLKDRAHTSSNGNLDNIFQDIIPLSPLDEDAMYAIIMQRVDNTTWIDTRALELIIQYAAGNPREMILTIHNALLHNLHEKYLSVEHILKEIKMVLEININSYKLSESEQKFLSLTFKKQLVSKPKSQIVKQLPEMSRSTVYECFKTLKAKGIVTDENNFRVATRIELWYKNFV